jgi:hypothetical protein
LRAFLGNYILNAQKPVSINEISRFTMSDANLNSYKVAAQGFFKTTDPKECVKVRPIVLENITKNVAGINFVKTHSANDHAHNTQLIPPTLTRSAIYILRNPLDMVISYASHFGIPIDRALESIGSANNTLKGNDAAAYQFIGKWANHVTTWANARKFPVLILRYEDMLANPHETFGKVVKHIGLPTDMEKLERAIDFSSFEVLQKQELALGFSENSKKQDRFFRQGKSDQWQNQLTPAQIDKVCADHGGVMKRYGYFPD